MGGDEDLDAGLLGITLADSDTDPGDNNGNNNNGVAAPKKLSQEARTAQSEADFQAVKQTYQVKVENGEIWKTVSLPLSPPVAKPEAQALLHAVEELYFFRRFSEGAQFARSIIDDDAGGEKLDGDTLQTLLYYEKRCQDRMKCN
ncbi:hypothetical protein F4777DRAFT_82665 [Nemania sp. FL0916]|nr:hypothetical protein F4777DRAFT_82665 [Nemania sp. FL0916]